MWEHIKLSVVGEGYVVAFSGIEASVAIAYWGRSIALAEVQAAQLAVDLFAHIHHLTSITMKSGAYKCFEGEKKEIVVEF